MTAGVRDLIGIYRNTLTLHKSSHWQEGHGLFLTNHSGGNFVSGDAGIVESSADETVKTTTTYRDLRKCVVLPQEIVYDSGTGDNIAQDTTVNDTQAEWFFASGYVPAVQVTGSVSINEYLYFSTTAGKLVGSGVVRTATQKPPQGAVGYTLEDRTGAGLVKMHLYEETVSAPMNTSSASFPTVNDDVSLGYSVESRWLYTPTNAVFICTDNSDGAAVWGPDGTQKIADVSPAAAASVDLTSIPQLGGDLIIRGTLRPATDDVDFRVRLNNRSGATDYQWAVDAFVDSGSDNSDDHIELVTGVTAAAGVGNAAAESIVFEIVIPNYAQVIGGVYMQISAHCTYLNPTTLIYQTRASAVLQFAEVIDRVTLYFESGNVTEGRVRAYITPK